MGTRFLGRALLAAALLLVGGCREGVWVDVTEHGDGIEIAVSPRTTLTQPCVDSLSVYSGDDEATAIWQVSHANDRGCVSRFIIGVTPPGFAPGVAYRPPVRGVTYRVDVSGTSFIGGSTFVVGGRDGRIGHG